MFNYNLYSKLQNEFKERGTTFPPSPGLPSLHCDEPWGHWKARAESHTDTKSHQITPKHQYSVKPMTTRTASPMGMGRILHLTEARSVGMNRGKRDLSSLPNPMQGSVVCSFHSFSSSPMIWYLQPEKSLRSSRRADREHHCPGSQEEKPLPAPALPGPGPEQPPPDPAKRGTKKESRG